MTGAEPQHRTTPPSGHAPLLRETRSRSHPESLSPPQTTTDHPKRQHGRFAGLSSSSETVGSGHPCFVEHLRVSSLPLRRTSSSSIIYLSNHRPCQIIKPPPPYQLLHLHQRISSHSPSPLSTHLKEKYIYRYSYQEPIQPGTTFLPHRHRHHDDRNNGSRCPLQ